MTLVHEYDARARRDQLLQEAERYRLARTARPSRRRPWRRNGG